MAGDWISAGCSCAPQLTPLFEATLAAADWQSRQQPLAQAYEIIAGMHNSLGVTPPVNPAVRPFFDRPFRVIFADRFADALRDAIANEALRALPPIGGVDQFVDCGNLTDEPALAAALRGVYG